MVEEVVQLGQYGTIGVMLALILVVIFFGWIIFKLASNHINHNTDAQIKLAQSLEGLDRSVNENTKTTEKLYEKLT